MPSSQKVIAKSRIAVMRENIRTYEENIKSHLAYIKRNKAKLSKITNPRVKKSIYDAVRERERAIRINKAKIAKVKKAISKVSKHL